jgi:hypothetical protein
VSFKASTMFSALEYAGHLPKQSCLFDGVFVFCFAVLPDALLRGVRASSNRRLSLLYSGGTIFIPLAQFSVSSVLHTCLVNIEHCYL